MPADPRLTDRDLELLSAYIDDELSSSERTTLEARLEHEPQLRRELRALRQTVELVRLTPRVRAPRDFTLTPEMVRPPRVLFFPATAAFSALSAVAAAVFVILGLLLLVQRDGLLSTGTTAVTEPAGAIALAPTIVTEAAEPELFTEADQLVLTETPQLKTEVIEAAATVQPTIVMPPPSLPQAEPGTGRGAGGGGAGGDDAAGGEMPAPQMFAPPVDSFAQGEGMYDMSVPQSALPAPLPEHEPEVGALAEEATGARSAAPAEESEAPSIMMAVPEADEAEAAAQIAQEPSPTATASPTTTLTSTPTATATVTPMPAPTAIPVPLIRGGSAGILGLLFVVLGILAFGLFALSQAARRRRG